MRIRTLQKIEFGDMKSFMKKMSICKKNIAKNLEKNGKQVVEIDTITQNFKFGCDRKSNNSLVGLYLSISYYSLAKKIESSFRIDHWYIDQPKSFIKLEIADSVTLEFDILIAKPRGKYEKTLFEDLLNTYKNENEMTFQFLVNFDRVFDPFGYSCGIEPDNADAPFGHVSKKYIEIVDVKK